MCLATPMKVVSFVEGTDHTRAIVEMGGIRKEISLALVDDITPGDYVIVHVGYALQKMDVAEAERTLDLLADIERKERVPPQAAHHY